MWAEGTTGLPWWALGRKSFMGNCLSLPAENLKALSWCWSMRLRKIEICVVSCIVHISLNVQDGLLCFYFVHQSGSLPGAICEIHKRRHDFKRRSKQSSIQDSCITSCALQYHLSIIAVSIQSWGTETWLWSVPTRLVQKKPDLNLIFSVHIHSLSRRVYFSLSEVHSCFVCCAYLDTLALAMPTSLHPKHIHLKMVN